MKLLNPDLAQKVRVAAQWIASADAIVITAGAGLGVDSGLPDFRGDQGLWKAYPALGRAGLAFKDIATPEAFRVRPELAWGFYGHRLSLYRKAAPHAGFSLLQAIAEQMPKGFFVFTSNVDGQFQKAGFSERHIVEVHGSIHHLQCLGGCRRDIWAADGFEPEVDAPRCHLVVPPPRCPHCSGIARPNIYMFEDWGWLDHRTREQQARYSAWYRQAGRVVTLEIGAGASIPTVRRFSETTGSRLVRINPQHEPLLPSHAIHLRTTGLAGILAVFSSLAELGMFPLDSIDAQTTFPETNQPEGADQ